MDNSMTSIKHNKIKNTGILFELLTRQITADVLQGKSTSIAESIMQRHFNPKTDLGKELMLYRSFFNIMQLSEAKAFRFITLLLEQHNKINSGMLASQKFNLIRDIKEHYDLKAFAKSRVPSYKIYASIYQLFEANIQQDRFDVDSVATAQFTLVEHLMGQSNVDSVNKERKLMESVRSKTQSGRIQSYKELLEQFNQKYAHLSEKQKNLLREYIYNISTSNKLQLVINKEAKELHEKIEAVLGKVDNTVTQIKLREVLVQLGKLSEATTIKENHITSMLFAYEIYQELQTMGIAHG